MLNMLQHARQPFTTENDPAPIPTLEKPYADRCCVDSPLQTSEGRFPKKKKATKPVKPKE